MGAWGASGGNAPSIRILTAQRLDQKLSTGNRTNLHESVNTPKNRERLDDAEITANRDGRSNDPKADATLRQCIYRASVPSPRTWRFFPMM